MDRFVECVPNFSEGRNPDFLKRLVSAIESVPETAVLDTHMDPDHNRSVITFIADPAFAVQAAISVVAAAATMIDMRLHSGEHPRLGATDVLPFVPIRNVSLDECVRLAVEAGERIARELGIPVYLYESAARRADRVNLEDVRRGGYEKLALDIASVPERAPDFGTPALHETAGAIAIGARPLLVAYNINLRTKDVAIARRIARAVRGRNGGPRYLKALGVTLHKRGMTQVSMNLTRFESTGLQQAFEAVRREAERWGVEIAGSEIVGLLPRAALESAAEYYLRFESFKPESILENRIDWAVEKRNEQGSATAISGGGVAAAHAAALAAALGQTLARMFHGRESNTGTKGGSEGRAAPKPANDVREILNRLPDLRSRLLRLARQDEAAFAKVRTALRMPHSSPEQAKARDEQLENVLKEATGAPLEIARISAEIASALLFVAENAHPSWLPDAAAGAQLATAAVSGARYNVLVNTAKIRDQDFASRSREEASQFLDKTKEITNSIEAKLTSYLGH